MVKKEEKKANNGGSMFEDRRIQQIPIEPNAERRKKKFNSSDDWYLKVSISKTSDS